MKSFKFFSLVVAAVSALLALPSFSQTAGLYVGGIPVATCTYDSGAFQGGTLQINCTTSVIYTGTGGGTGPYALIVSASPSAGGTFACGSTGGACAATYPATTQVPVTAVPATGYTFQSWATGPCAASTNPLCTVTFTNAAIAMTANFGSSTTSPPPPGVVMVTTPLPPICGTAAGSTFSGTVGTTYAWPLTHTSTGNGSIQATAAAGANNSYSIEMSISKVPGDWTTAQSMTVTTLTFPHTTTHPYYGVFGAESASLTWAPATDSKGSAVVPTTEQWYFNLRFVNAGSTVTLQVTSPTCS
jgi:hypothetical protein